jgi:Fe(3+) dicitrate transport protein
VIMYSYKILIMFNLQIIEKKYLFLLIAFIHLFLPQVKGQNPDTLLFQELKTVTIQGYKFQMNEVTSLDAVHGTYITSGRKSEIIQVNDLPANVAEKNGRQIFAKIPGAFIYDMDGSGNQVNISTRGLDPHRSWEYNVRQNGIMTNSDIYGYPASHYSPPMEAIQKIELIRGTGSLQYGSQFGGMINYITKQGDTTKALSFEALHSIGSFGLMSTFISMGGKKGKLSYYGYYQRRVSDGYRENSRSDAQAQFISLQYAFSKNLTLKGELGRNQYIYQVPGPLTDEMFRQNPRQSTRSRNYFNPDIFVPSLTLEWKTGKHSFLEWTTSAVLGVRNSLQFIGFADAKDTINPATGQYKPRQVDIDGFNSYTSELRWLQEYVCLRKSHTLIAGLRYINNDLHRRQLGKGTTGTDYDLTVTDPVFGRNVHLKTRNVAVFVENLFRITSKLDFTVGARLENGVSKMTGEIVYLQEDITKQSIGYHFPLFGASFQYQITGKNKVYGGWSQAYRPVIFADLIPGTILEKTDPSITNAFGHNLEIGVKGKLGRFITYDINAFQIHYQNRIGTLVLQDDNQETYFWKTNIGDSRTNGLECYLEGVLLSVSDAKISVFTSTSWFDGKYTKGRLRKGNENIDIAGNRIESVPEWISRSGLQLGYKRITAVLQYSYVSETYADAFNTETPSSNGATGVVPSYGIWDINLAIKLHANVLLRCGVNNVTNVSYFTKRPTGYPGGGVWSSDGRSLVATIGFRF